MMANIKEYNKEYNAKCSKNFRVNEFSCKGKGCCKTVKLDMELVEILQKIRDNFNQPVTITSGYRCKTHNKAVGGASNSYHTKGQAADIVVKNVSPTEVAKYAEGIGVLGIGCYTGSDGNFVHLDTREKKAFWWGQAQKACVTFGGTSMVRTWQDAAMADGYKFDFTENGYGLWGSNCEKVAKEAVCKRHAVGYKNKNLTKIVQYAVGVSVDGKFGKNTETAVKKYQQQQGLVADGIVGRATWKSLLGV